MSVRVGKYNYKTKKEPETAGYQNILIHTTGPLSPYVMKDQNGVIMENYWQFSKVWEQVPAMKQFVSRWQPNVVRWQHNSEVHMVEGQLTPTYWNWREKGFHHKRWVRYPVGYQYHAQAVGSVIGTPDDYEIVGYLEARKRIYFPKYKEICEQTALFGQLKEQLQAGQNIQINEVDGPRFDPHSPPFDQVIDGSLEITPETLEQLVNNPSQAFGHGYCLATCLLDIDISVF